MIDLPQGHRLHSRFEIFALSCFEAPDAPDARGGILDDRFLVLVPLPQTDDHSRTRAVAHASPVRSQSFKEASKKAGELLKVSWDCALRQREGEKRQDWES